MLDRFEKKIVHCEGSVPLFVGVPEKVLDSIFQGDKPCKVLTNIFLR